MKNRCWRWIIETVMIPFWITTTVNGLKCYTCSGNYSSLCNTNWTASEDDHHLRTCDDYHATCELKRLTFELERPKHDIVSRECGGAFNDGCHEETILGRKEVVCYCSTDFCNVSTLVAIPNILLISVGVIWTVYKLT